MPDGAYNPDLLLISDGEAVEAAVVNRPTQRIGQNEQYLKNRLDAAEVGQGAVAPGVALDSAVLVGQPVTYNSLTGLFEQALAQVIEDPVSHTLTPSYKAQVVGLVIDKNGLNVGDMLTSGRAAVSIANAVVGAVTPGLYYLSSSTPGMLVTQRPPIGIPILFYDGTYAYFGPRLQDFIESHVHYRFDMACKPAGNNVIVSSRHTIPAPDPTQLGWLPANHAVFNGKAPTGAVFGYNLSEDTGLASVWPPIPLSSAVFWWHKADGTDNGGQLLRQGLNGYVSGDVNGIWWMTNCLGDVPWPQTYNSSSPPPPVPNATVPPTCPVPDAMELVISFTQMLFATDKTMVTSLSPSVGSPVTVVDCNGNPATTGDLFINVNLAFLTDSTLNDGFRVFKSLVGQVLKAGNVVEGIFAGDNIALTSSTTETVGSDTLYQGRITASVNLDPIGHSLEPQVIRLENVKERRYQGVLYLGFPAGQTTYIMLRFDVPVVGLPGSPQVTFRFSLLGTVAGTLPVTTLSVLQMVRPSGITPLALPVSPVSVSLNTNVSVGTYQYLEVTSGTMDVNPGDTLIATFSRGSSDGYTGEVGIIRVEAVIGGS